MLLYFLVIFLMEIKALGICGYAALAPMAGAADRSFRIICRRFGAAYTVSELISSKGVSLGSNKSREMLRLSDEERPAAVQLFGCDPAVMADAARYALQFGPDFIDINMGCPAPKVAGNGCGSALLKDPPLAASIVKAVVDAVDVPVTVKIRSGWDAASINAVEVAQRCEAAGAAAITVHGRTREQMYAPSCDLGIIRDVKRAVSIPVIGNGDVTDAKSAARMYEETGCDFIMVGRAALGAPWIFSQINAYLSDENRTLCDPPVSERMRVLLMQAKLTTAEKGEHKGINEMRKHAAWYMNGLRGAAGYRRECGELSSLEQLAELCYRVCKENE